MRQTLKGFGSWRTLSAFPSYFNREPRVGAQRQPWDQNIKKSLNPERVRQSPNPFRVWSRSKITSPRVLTMLEPWAEISERLRRNHLIKTDAVRVKPYLKKLPVRHTIRSTRCTTLTEHL